MVINFLLFCLGFFNIVQASVANGANVDLEELSRIQIQQVRHAVINAIPPTYEECLEFVRNSTMNRRSFGPMFDIALGRLGRIETNATQIDVDCRNFQEYFDSLGLVFMVPLSNGQYYDVVNSGTWMDRGSRFVFQTRAADYYESLAKRDFDYEGHHWLKPSTDNRRGEYINLSNRDVCHQLAMRMAGELRRNTAGRTFNVYTNTRSQFDNAYVFIDYSLERGIPWESHTWDEQNAMTRILQETAAEFCQPGWEGFSMYQWWSMRDNWNSKFAQHWFNKVIAFNPPVWNLPPK